VADEAVLWFRRDLRLRDNPALEAAAKAHRVIVPVFVWSPEEAGDWPPGGASQWWLHRSLEALDAALRARGSRLTLRAGPPLEALRALLKATGTRAVYWNEQTEPSLRQRDAAVREALEGGGIACHTFAPCELVDGDFLNKQGRPYQVFTPFYRAASERARLPAPLPAPKQLGAPARWPDSLPLDALDLHPRHPWADGLEASWPPGEAGAWARLKAFQQEVAAYPEARDVPGGEGTSRLSPHLHFGEISAPRVALEITAAAESRGGAGALRGAEAFVRQLYWRAFAEHLLRHFPETPEQPLRPAFARFPWRDAPADLRAWQRGQTGYPIVDAGMRQLWRTGWMHNRVRMIVGSFLVKDLLLPWQAGARWFWDTLVDADLANNTLGWQWIAGCGADAAPYFRIFNPVRQGEKFDADGAYVRTWVPELAAMPDRWLHCPWEAPREILDAAQVRLGQTYPHPIVDHAAARAAALEAYAQIKAGGAAPFESRGESR